MTFTGTPIVKINGVTVTVASLPPIQDAIGQRSKVDFVVLDTTGALAIAEFQSVSITDAIGTPIFGGFVSEATFSRVAYAPATYGWTVRCMDNIYLAEKRIAAATYVNKTCGFIVNDLITNYLAAEGVTVGQVDAGPTLTAWSIDYQNVASQLDKLAQLAGFWWNIDASKKLWFCAYTTTAAPFTFDGSQGDGPDGNSLIAIQNTSPLYRNGQYVLGITEVTSSQTETRQGDGKATAFTFSYPLHAVPTVTVNAVSKTVGIAGVDAGKDWYWNKGSNVLSQDTAGTKLISTDTLSVTYVGEYKTLVYSQDDGQVTMQQTLEGGGTTGKVQAVITDTTIITSSQGFQVATSLLAKYATSGKVLTFKTLTGGLAAGQLLTVNMPAVPWNLSNVQFLIESVNWLYDGFQWWADVKALDGPVNDTWVNFFKRIAQTVGVVDTSSSGVSQTVSLLQTITETWNWTESVTPTVYACPVFPATFPLTLC